MIDVYGESIARLRAAGVKNADGELCALLSFCTGIPYEEIRRAVLLSSSGSSYAVADEETAARVRKAVGRREAGEPLQYITGETDFYGMTFRTKPGVLIPRFDTECVLEETVNALRRTNGKARLLDLCCGSGCIGIAAAVLTGCDVTLADISEDALCLSAENASLHGVGATILRHDVLGDSLDGTFDVIVSNPPYIPTADIDGLSREVKREPRTALDGGEDGLLFYRVISEKYKKNLRPGGTLCYEIGIGQREALRSILTENGYSDISFTKDLGGIDRAVVSVNRKG